MRKFMRQLMPGQEFTLVRTGVRYKFLRRDYSTPSGTRYICLNLSAMPVDQYEERYTSLHHACHVWVSNGSEG
jgi:hypothetical protein